ncbi:mitochondrial ribosomal protein [Nadsonia fulvescens var. elongata DSM 6958]|uniref:Large ribosomal subunit protein uL2m n=1 Tax=Nadsonia fulvescens var. elongata DSM 6958 TaxID=857566 RepID=A0A1E3PKY1_9ASCO|nr:mitochondrial ribosomal protein [Nadsonia fulvescens var. elongata DSM 6958]
MALPSRASFSTTSISSQQKPVDSKKSEGLDALYVGMSELKIVPDAVELTDLEKQDALIRRRRKLARANVVMRKYKPQTPGLRWFKTPKYDYLHTRGPHKPLTFHKKRFAGRNNSGKIVVRHRGGGHRRRIRIIDFFRKDMGAQEVVRIERDPGRTSHIALVKNQRDGKLSYILACDGLRAGDLVQSFRNGIPEELIQELGGNVDPAVLSSRTNQRGNCLPMEMIPIGSVIHNISLTPHGPAQLCRAAGAYGRLIAKLPENNKVIVKLSSGEQRYVHYKSCATMGVVSNQDHQLTSLGKAGRNRWKGRRPSVRGVAMNAGDHPHGGGRGKSKGNVPSQSPWGVLAKGGFKTRVGKNINYMKVIDRPRGKTAR